MKVPTSPLLLLLLSSLPTIHSLTTGASANVGDYVAATSRESLLDADLGSPPSPVKSPKSDPGTKFAPFDGHDGMPHVGPNIRPLSSETDVKKKSDSAKVAAAVEKSQAEDSVMNDPNRKAPKKGTTGTEGGVSEKDRNRKELEAITGEKLSNKPEAPKEAPPALKPASEKALDSNKKTPTKDKSASKEPLKSEFGDKKGAPGIKKPDHLPDTLHDVSYPAPGSASPHKASLPEADSDDDGDDFDEMVENVKWDALVASFTSIAATEVGDKTFIVAALMAMRHPRLQVFSAAFSALVVMTILSAVTGHAVGALISKQWASLLAAILFFVFGAKSLREGFEMDPNQGVGEEMREVQAELDEKEVDIARQEGRRRASSISPYALEAGNISRSRSRSNLGAASRSASSSPSGAHSAKGKTSLFGGIKNLLGLVLSPAWVETFSMTFIGELGDRSQIATVAMAAGQEYFWVMAGATIGHFFCTGAAVIGGSVLAGRITMRRVTLIGGAIFIGFGIFTLFDAAQNWR